MDCTGRGTVAPLLTILSLILLLITSPSCMLRGPEGMRRAVAQSTGAEYERRVTLTLGRVSLALARLAMDDEEEVYLDGVRKVRVGVYEVAPGSPEPAPLDQRVLPGWDPLITVEEDDEDVHVFLRREEGRTREMLVVVSGADELVIVRLKGRLDGMLDHALGLAFQEAGREELAGPVIVQLPEETDA